jgi:hypothetical protein
MVTPFQYRKTVLCRESDPITTHTLLYICRETRRPVYKSEENLRLMRDLGKCVLGMYVCMYIAGEGPKRPQHRDHPWSIVL